MCAKGLVLAACPLEVLWSWLAALLIGWAFQTVGERK